MIVELRDQRKHDLALLPHPMSQLGNRRARAHFQRSDSARYLIDAGDEHTSVSVGPLGEFANSVWRKVLSVVDKQDLWPWKEAQVCEPSFDTPVSCIIT